jgi:hypothetical protein
MSRANGQIDVGSLMGGRGQAPEVADIDIRGGLDSQSRVGSVDAAADEEIQDQDDPHLARLDNVNNQLSQLNQTAAQNATLGSLLADPNIAAYLAAKQGGKKVKIVDDVPQDDLLQQIPQDNNEPAPNWEELGQNPEKMAGHVVKSTVKELGKTLLPMIGKVLESKINNLGIDNLSQQVQGLLGVVQGYQREKLSDEMNQIRNANPQEFDRLKPVMAELLKTMPNAKLKQLYLLARAEAGLPLTPDQSSQTERPTVSTASRPGQQVRPQMPQQRQRQQIAQQRSIDPNVNFTDTLKTLLEGRDFSGLPGVQ